MRSRPEFFIYSSGYQGTRGRYLQSSEYRILCSDELTITLIAQNDLLSVNTYGRHLKIDFIQEVSFQKQRKREASEKQHKQNPTIGQQRREKAGPQWTGRSGTQFRVCRLSGPTSVEYEQTFGFPCLGWPVWTD